MSDELYRRTEKKLAEFDLTPQDFEDAIWAGINARRAVPPSAVETSKGYADWTHRHGTLRETLLGRGWSLLDHHGAPFSRHPKVPMALGVLQGDAGTGDRNAPLTSRYDSGTRTAELTLENDNPGPSQFALFDPATGDSSTPTAPIPGLKVWFLVTWWNDIEHQVRAEFSQPKPIDGARKITDWAERFPLPPLDFRPNAGPSIRPGDPADPDELDFEIPLR
ncbi:hypothetical protein [Actinoalloteichus hymeniacidonis]|uniref:Uncharacterized protein n=1 Tax=Actinoalloteichus hymeniacidonis TaxID=340345 RepID=A0AAC9N027_9PSEU|nr:hypothetical protein [Actinoalloteichus hymeniacidonis]AOS64965.1 hypothetical protein TL08_20870 [Actinoalloteichus hymeniacidonis]MBB5906960.1 hypothetical protein [Actinoalloteichus hymeniacidonis]